MVTKTKRAEATGSGETPSNIVMLPRGERRQIPIKDIAAPSRGTGEDRLTRAGDDARIQEIAASMRVVGQLQPIMVESIGGMYTVLFGRRRLAAAALAGLTEIDAVVVPAMIPDARRMVVAIENMQRQDLTPVEESIAVAELLRLSALKAGEAVSAVVSGVTITKDVIDEIWAKPDKVAENAYIHDILEQPRARAKACEMVAAALGKTSVWVRDRMYVGRLGTKGRKLVQDGKLPLTHAREIAKVADPAMREDLAVRFAAGGDDSRSDSEAGDFLDLRLEVGTRVFSLAQVPWRLDIAFASQRACEGCPHNTATNPGLFEHGGGASTKMVGGVGQHQVGIVDGKGLVCTLHSCYSEKLIAAKRAVTNAAVKITDQAERKDKSPVQVPAFLNVQAVDAKVKERKERAKSRERVGAPIRESSPKEVKREAEQTRNNEVRDAMRPLLEAVEKISRKSAFVRAALLLWDSAFVEGRAPRDSAATLKRIAAVTPETAGQLLHDLAAGTVSDAFALSPWSTDEETAKNLAAAFGLTMKDVPPLAHFMPKKPKAEKPTANPKADTKPADAKPAKGGKAKARA